MTDTAISNKELKARFNSIRKGDDFTNPVEVIPHRKILNRLLKEIEPISFKEEADLGDDEKVLKKHKVIISVEKILELAQQNDWGLCKKHDFIYIYNGAYWDQLNEESLKNFLGTAALKMEAGKFDADYYRFGDELLSQFKYKAHLPIKEEESDAVLINLKNGTLEINPDSTDLINLRDPKREDFITYQLPFKYKPNADAPRFIQYLDEVLPDKDLQKILAEYIGYVFVKTSQLKLEKALILHGSGANGKSVFYDIVNALLGDENFSSYSLYSLTNGNGYYRAKIGNKLVNYSSEISTSMDTPLFKQLVSGEPIEARLPYGKPFTQRNYAKLIFNSNELPTNVEHTDAFFRRFMIVPFEVTIPEEQQDKQLAKKIISSELSGVFNWVLDGLKRVLNQKRFTKSDVIEKRNKQYRKETDNVLMFIDDRGYKIDYENPTELAELYTKYKRFCEGDAYHPVSKRKFSKRLESAGYQKKRITAGMAFCINKAKL